MAIQVVSVKLTSIAIDPSLKLQGSYELIGSKGNVVAKQSFNGYNDMVVEPTTETRKALQGFMKCLTQDIEISIGIEEAVKSLK